jgi:hypothetical protein
MTTNGNSCICLSSQIKDCQLLFMEGYKRLPRLVLILIMMSPVSFVQLGAGSDDNREEERDFSDYNDERRNSDSSERQERDLQHDPSMGEDEILSGSHMGDGNGYDINHDLFEKSLQGTPESVIIEIGNVGIEVFLDYILFLEGQGNGGDVLVNPARTYGVGSFSLIEGQSILLDFDDCHSIDCRPPEKIRSVYLVDSETDDIDIVNANIDAGEIISLQQSETDKFEYKMPEQIKTISSDRNPNEDSSHKIVIHTEQKGSIDAFYITGDVEISTSLESY